MFIIILLSNAYHYPLTLTLIHTPNHPPTYAYPPTHTHMHSHTHNHTHTRTQPHPHTRLIPILHHYFDFHISTARPEPHPTAGENKYPNVNRNLKDCKRSERCHVQKHTPNHPPTCISTHTRLLTHTHTHTHTHPHTHTHTYTHTPSLVCFFSKKITVPSEKKKTFNVM